MAAIPATVLVGTPRIDQMTPPHLEVAVFGMGSFLGAEPWFGVTRGIWRTSVGYAGGRDPSPSYDDTGDHTEAVKVEYDPTVISYGQLLELFLLWHRPLENPFSSRHASRIFVKNEAEKRLAQAAMDRYEFCMGTPVRTQTAVFRNFSRAENWCQKYFLRTAHWLMMELEQFYPDEESFIRSTLAMRLNGFLGHQTSIGCLPDAMELYDLSERAVHILKRILS